jgi:hypothetical protein
MAGAVVTTSCWWSLKLGALALWIIIATCLGPLDNFALLGTAAGALVAWGQQARWQRACSSETAFRSGWRLVLGALSGAMLSFLSLAVATTLASELGGLWGLMAAGAAGTLVFSLTGLSAQVAMGVDPVDLHVPPMPAILSELQSRTKKLVQLYRACCESLAQLPADRSTRMLRRTLQAFVCEALGLVSRWIALEPDLEDLQGSTPEEPPATDPLALDHQRVAATLRRERLARVEALRAAQERTLARLNAQVETLDHTRVSLLELRASHAELKSVAVAALISRISALNQAQADEAELARAVMADAEINQLQNVAR